MFDGAGRRQTIVDVCRSARQSLILSLFRCDDFGIISEITGAVQRGVAVRVLMSRDARGWKKRLQRLAGLLQSAGAEIQRYNGAIEKYHAKYLVADDTTALVSSSNLTHKCFKSTCDFLFRVHDRAVVTGLKDLFEHDCRTPGLPLPPLSERLIIGPETARGRLTSLLESAKSSISIMDHRVTDSRLIDVIESRKRDGVNVTILGRGVIDGMISHGKMLVIDERIGAIGSVALSPPSLDSRRELAVTIEEPELVAGLSRFFEYCTGRHVPGRPPVPGADDDDEDGEDAPDETD